MSHCPFQTAIGQPQRRPGCPSERSRFRAQSRRCRCRKGSKSDPENLGWWALWDLQMAQAPGDSTQAQANLATPDLSVLTFELCTGSKTYRPRMYPVGAIFDLCDTHPHFQQSPDLPQPESCCKASIGGLPCRLPPLSTKQSSHRVCLSSRPPQISACHLSLEVLFRTDESLQRLNLEEKWKTTTSGEIGQDQYQNGPPQVVCMPHAG